MIDLVLVLLEKDLRVLLIRRFVLVDVCFFKLMLPADKQRREGPVQFERDTAVADPFGVSAFLESAKTGVKRGLDTGDDEARKRQRE